MGRTLLHVVVLDFFLFSFLQNTFNDIHSISEEKTRIRINFMITAL